MTEICPEDVLRILLPAGSIPSGSTVSKRTGEATLILRHGLKVYSDTKGEKPMEIDGLFLVDGSGNINQTSPKTLFHWHVAAEALIDELQLCWEETPQ